MTERTRSAGLSGGVTDIASGAKPVRVASHKWRSHLLLGDKGKALPVLANAITALQRAPQWSGVLAFDEFSFRIVTFKKTPWGEIVANWGDQEDRLTADWLQHRGIMVRLDVARQAVLTVARGRSFHPVRGYLDSLKWDGVPRIDTWLSQFFGVQPSDYVSAIGSRWLISAVARVTKPGVKADCALIFEGVQGMGKSTAFSILGGDWYTDDISEFGSKDSIMQAHTAWILELAELDSLKGADVNKIKAFMSRMTDRFRPPYGRHVGEFPRQFVFGGSTNRSDYLRDETGGRRFWPVQCGNTIDLDGLKRDRDQLWAEACVRYKAGARWWLDTPELTKVATDEQESRYEGDPWDPPISNFIASRTSVSIEEVLTGCVVKPTATWTQHDKNRIARSLKAQRWERYQGGTGARRTWRYRPTSGELDRPGQVPTSTCGGKE